MAGSLKDRLALRIAPYVAGAGFLAATLSQANVQLVERDRLLELGQTRGRWQFRTPQPASRGAIVSADGVSLAQDEDAFRFGVRFDAVPNSAGFYMELGNATGVSGGELKQVRDSGVKSRIWSNWLTRRQAERVLEVKTSWQAHGVWVDPKPRRVYPLGEAAGSFVGYLRDDHPVAGLELSQADHLAGVDGEVIGLRDRTGAFLPTRSDSGSRPRKDGQTLVLTIDSQIQLASTIAIRRVVEENQADRGSIVVIRPESGDILAMANWPSLDPEEFSKVKPKGDLPTDYNPNYMGALEPGSTFKILTLALGLQEGVIREDERFYCSGSLPVWANTSIRCDAHGGSRAHGAIDPQLAISKSCNVCAATWAMRIGHERFVQFLDDSGLTRKTRLGLPSEQPGRFHRNEYAKRLQLATFGFGQSLTCTPVGLAGAFAAIGNGGVRMEPRLLERIGDTPIPRERGTRIFSPEVASTVLRFMEGVVETDAGTGKTLRIAGYRLAGKTGTAQKINSRTGTVEGGGYVSNFVGFVPAEKPQAMALVMVDHPKSGRYYGATVAGPAFVEVARSLIRRLGIPPSPPRPGPQELLAPSPLPSAQAQFDGPTTLDLAPYAAQPARRGVTP